MDPREIVQIILEALRRRGYEADVRNLTMSVDENPMRSMGRGRLREFVEMGPAEHYELDINLIIDRRSVESVRAREQWERERYEFGPQANPNALAESARPMTNAQIGDYFRDGLIPEPTNTFVQFSQKAKQLRVKNGKFAARPRVAFVDVCALVRSLRMPVAFIDVFALVKMLVDIADWGGDLLVRASLLEYD